METPLLIKGLYKKPFRYDQTNIFDSNNNHFINVRSWSFLAMHYDSTEKAAQAQDAIGEYVTKLLNDNYEE